VPLSPGDRGPFPPTVPGSQFTQSCVLLGCQLGKLTPPRQSAFMRFETVTLEVEFRADYDKRLFSLLTSDDRC
jgi:hypothetical protein